MPAGSSQRQAFSEKRFTSKLAAYLLTFMQSARAGPCVLLHAAESTSPCLGSFISQRKNLLHINRLHNGSNLMKNTNVADQTAEPTMQDFRPNGNSPERAGMADGFLFVSHTTADGAAAMEIVQELERRGVHCWIAPRDVRPGRPFDDEIANAIEASQAMLLIFTEHCNDSEYIRREVTVAGESHKVVIPLRIENAAPKHGLRVRLSDLHWLDAFASREQAINELLRMFPATKKEAVSGAAAQVETAPPPFLEPTIKEARSGTDAERQKREIETEKQKAKKQRFQFLRADARALWPSSRRVQVAASLIGLALLGAIGVWLLRPPPIPVPAPTSASAHTFHFQVCNQSNVEASVATASHISQTDDRYVVQGWWSVGAGSCMWIGYFQQGDFYYYAEQTSTQKTVWKGKDAQICVQYPGPFKRINTANYTCQSGEELRDFTDSSISDTTRTFTWNLN